jgi:hypothetical protein
MGSWVLRMRWISSRVYGNVSGKVREGGKEGKTNAVGGAGVGHGVTSISVGDEFVDEGTLAVGGPLLAECDGLLAGEDVHAVDLETGDVLATLVVLGDGRRAVGGGTHTVLVVWRMELVSSKREKDGNNSLSQAKMTGRFHSLAML